MATGSDLRHLTKYEHDDDDVAELRDRTPEDRIDFDPLRRGQSEGEERILVATDFGRTDG